MTSQLLKRSSLQFLSNRFTNMTSCLLSFESVSLVQLQDTKNYRIRVDKNEKQWLKETSLKLIENAKKEKGPTLDIDLDAPALYFDKSDELKDASETVKRLLSLRFAKNVDFKRYEEEMIKRMFQSLPIEQDSLEIKIALHTLTIKRICQFLEENGKVRSSQFFLYRQIHRRDRYLCQLFYQNNKRYEEVIKLLGLDGYEIKESYPYKRVTKYQKFIDEVRKEAEAMRHEKLMTQKKLFEKERIEFNAKRDSYLAYIDQQLNELGLTPKPSGNDSSKINQPSSQ